MNGILLINKPAGYTSRDVVNKICHEFKTKKVGHTGTLDPLATGVLVITLGKFTKLNDCLTSTYKEYIAKMKLGILTDTLDITGTVLQEEKVTLTEEQIREAIKSFVGYYDQEVPIYSAVKVNGKKLYEYARNGENVILPKRKVHIKEMEILSINGDVIEFRVVVSKGTYIRSLIRDIGTSLNTSATMLELIRTKQGDFSIEESFTLDEVLAGNYQIKDINNILDMDIIYMDEELYKKISNGVKYYGNEKKEYILFKMNEKDIALYKKYDDVYKMFLLLEDKK